MYQSPIHTKTASEEERQRDCHTSNWTIFRNNDGSIRGDERKKFTSTSFLSKQHRQKVAIWSSPRAHNAMWFLIRSRLYWFSEARNIFVLYKQKIEYKHGNSLSERKLKFFVGDNRCDTLNWRISPNRPEQLHAHLQRTRITSEPIRWQHMAVDKIICRYAIPPIICAVLHIQIHSYAMLSEWRTKIKWTHECARFIYSISCFTVYTVVRLQTFTLVFGLSMTKLDVGLLVCACACLYR